LQNSHPTYNYDDFEEDNKEKRRILNRLWYFPYVLNKTRANSKLNIRRNLSISHSSIKRYKKHNKSLSQAPSSSQTIVESHHPNQNPSETPNKTVKEADESSELETQLNASQYKLNNIKILEKNEQTQSLKTNSMTVSEKI